MHWLRKAIPFTNRILLAVFLTVGCAQAQWSGHPDEISTEYKVKAAFLHSFPKFVEWPEQTFQSNVSPLKIGVMGSPEMAHSLTRFKDKKVHGRTIEIVKVDSFNLDGSLHILFIGKSVSEKNDKLEELRKALSNLSGAPILIVSESEGFLDLGGIINFYLERGKTRFEIHAEAAQRNQLVIGASLLRVARLVKN